MCGVRGVRGVRGARAQHGGEIAAVLRSPVLWAELTRCLLLPCDYRQLRRERGQRKAGLPVARRVATGERDLAAAAGRAVGGGGAAVACSPCS